MIDVGPNKQMRPPMNRPMGQPMNPSMGPRPMPTGPMMGGSPQLIRPMGPGPGPTPPMTPIPAVPVGNQPPMNGGGMIPPQTGGMDPMLAPKPMSIDTAPTNYMDPANAVIPGMGQQMGGNQMGGLRNAYNGNPQPQPFGMGNRRF